MEPTLTELQRELMSIVWDAKEVTVSEVWQELARSRPLARNTVQTLMVRLEEKGWLLHREEGRKFVYRAAKPRRSSLGSKVTQMIDRFFAGSAEEMVTALLEHRGLSEEEAKRIRKLIADSEKNPNSRNS